MKRGFIFSEGEFYHLYNRGIERRQIYMDEHDYKRAVLLLFLANSTNSVDIDDSLQKGLSFLDFWKSDRGAQLVDIGAWCLMPNHFHILVRETRQGGISTFMRTFGTAYSMYFNSRHQRTGRLMQGTYRAQHIDNDRYLQYLFSYIHLNPIKLIDGESDWKEVGVQNLERARNFIETYPYSSYNDYRLANSRLESQVLACTSFPWKSKYADEMSREVVDWLGSQKG